jgi:uncharacterized protein
MKIGIISDTHDHMGNCQKACAAFAADGITTVLHAGDMVAPFIAPVFHRAGLRLIAVYGNNDGEKLYLREKFAELGFGLAYGPHELELGGRRVCMMHEPRCLESLAASAKYDLIVYGHTHELAISEEGTLVINPGEACGYLSGRATCAVVDLESMSGRIIEL